MSEVELHLGDCLEVLPTLAGPIDAIITDLPYGTTACSWDVVIPFAPMWEQVKRLQARVFITTATQPFASALIMSNPSMFKYEWIWKKRRLTGHLDCRRRPLRTHEQILVFGNGNVTYNPQMIKGKIHPRGSRSIHADVCQAESVGGFKKRRQILSDEFYPQDVIEFAADKETTVTKKDRPGKVPMHPTQKPLALYEYLILTYTNPGDTVLDFCFGSGTTGVACVKLGRHFIGCEIRPDYYAVAERRIHDALLQMPMPMDCQ